MNFLVILMTKIVNHICFMLFSLKLIRCIFNFQGLIDFTCLENERQVQDGKTEGIQGLGLSAKGPFARGLHPQLKLEDIYNNPEQDPINRALSTGVLERIPGFT